MVIVKMNDSGPVTNGLGERNVLVQDHCNDMRDGLTGEGQDLSEEDESRINEDMEDLNNGNTEKVQGHTHGQAVRERQQPLGPKVNWESFLPQRSLKVLLVENDDSTRHVVCALLQNCGYEVTAVSDALQACKILEDPRKHIDLVLTEVVLPCLSGIGLLFKIMSHKTWKTIPVIMMSSHDSMGIVFKCLSKGAVDFLVKPIRKNELKNLWQHVWRKCHSSSGSGSESGIRTEKSTKSRSYYQSGSNNGKEAGSISLTSQDGSDSRSGIQSSWTKRAIEVDSPQPASPEEQLADPPDSTCAQAIHMKLEGSASNGVPVTMARECNLWDDGVDNVEMGKDLEMGVPNATIPLGKHTENVQNNKAGASKENFEVPPEDDDKEHGQLKLDSEKPSSNSFQDADLIGIDTNMSVAQLGFNITSGRPKVSDTKEDVIYDKGMPSLELSLKRVKDFGDTGTPIHECNVLRHSDFSAFSRYTSGSAAQKVPTEILGSCSPLDSSSEAAKTDQAKHLQSNSNSMPPNQRSNGSSNNEDMGSTTNYTFTKIKDFSDQQAPKSSVEQNGMVLTMQPRVQNSADASLAKMLLVHTKHMEQQVQVQHHHHHYHHYHHHLHEKPQQPDGLDDLSKENMAAPAASQYGSSNMSSVPHFEGNAGNNSLNGSASGSNNGSNGQNGSSTAVNTGGVVIKCEDLILVTDGPGTATGFGDRSGINFNRSSQREAALYKFRQKRKQRCFEKKVRYQSRKKLAEQRPRIRGQFVRQAQDSSNDARR